MEQEVKTELLTLPVSILQPTEKRLEQRRQKEKTRPSHSSTYEIASRAETPGAEEPAPSPQTFKSRGSVSWAAFEAALVDLGFSVLPKFGSIYTFLPPDTMAVKSFTVHRPHKSRIEGYMILVFARRLKRVYGWGEQTVA
ncbi:hypothetical protein QBC46DRAFT_451435 [Diplogelasinospora grovesii]|uniref:Uncharacterized protein n=1 Tax=Diplogelasinospora grovesii TaxID=303347 RepID=A0AAN6S2Z9_9PEZI|nr:hypothetical protein QBC46DRAFT_451435 [Diplogelasinospora grovesii]